MVSGRPVRPFRRRRHRARKCHKRALVQYRTAARRFDLQTAIVHNQRNNNNHTKLYGRLMPDVAFTAYAFPAAGASPQLVARTMPDRLADVINVKDYGAVGNDVHDDTLNIQAAIDAAFGPKSSPNDVINSYKNKILYFPPGRYLTSSMLLVFQVTGARILGSGSASTVIRCNDPNATVLQLAGFAYSRIDGITIKSPGSSSGMCVDNRRRNDLPSP